MCKTGVTPCPRFSLHPKHRFPSNCAAVVVVRKGALPVRWFLSPIKHTNSRCTKTREEGAQQLRKQERSPSGGFSLQSNIPIPVVQKREKQERSPSGSFSLQSNIPIPKQLRSTCGCTKSERSKRSWVQGETLVRGLTGTTATQLSTQNECPLYYTTF